MPNSQVGTVGAGVQLATQATGFASALFSLDDTLMSRALSLTGMSRQFSYWSDPFLDKPGKVAGTIWTNGNEPATPDNSTTNTFPGGVTKLISNAGYRYIIIDPNGEYPFAVGTAGESFFGVVSSSVPCYLFFRFRLLPSPGWVASENSVIMGVVDPTTLDVIGVGAAIGSSFWGAVGGTVLTSSATLGVPSLVARDFSVWHDGEIFSRLGHWWVKIDDGEAIDCGSVVAGTLVRATPFCQIMATGVTQPVIEIDHCAYAAISNRNQIAVQPAHPYP